MKTNADLMCHPSQKVLAKFAQVTAIDEYKEDRINKTLNGIVHVNRHANALVKDLFCPRWRSCAVVIRLRDGSYLNPCDFRFSHNRKRRQTNKKYL